MEPLTLAAILLMLFAFSLISKRTEGTIITAPISICWGWVFWRVKTTWALFTSTLNTTPYTPSPSLLSSCCCFADASRIKFQLLGRQHNLALRMLVIGLPLTILFGTGIANALFPNLSIWEAGLLAALLAPTDAALGQTVCYRQSGAVCVCAKR